MNSKTKTDETPTGTEIFQSTFTCLLTPWSRVLLQKQTGSHLVKKFPVFIKPDGALPLYKGHHLSLSWDRSIQSMPTLPTSWRSILILSSHLCLFFPRGVFLSGSPPKRSKQSSSPHTCYMPRQSHFLDLITRKYLVKCAHNQFLVM